MKKRIISLLLVICFLCAMLTACEETTSDMINNALKKTQALDSMNAEMHIDMEMSMQGMTLSIPITAAIKATGLQKENPTVLTDVSMSMFGQNIDVQLYQEGEWSYLVIADMKYKAKTADLEGEYDYSGDVDSMLQSIPEELLKDVKAKKNDDGSQTVTVSIPDEQFSEIYSEFLKDINSTTGADVDTTDLKIKDAVVTITVLNGYISVYDMELTMDMTVSDVATTSKIKASVTYKDPGKDVQITPPSGYQSFEELDTSITG